MSDKLSKVYENFPALKDLNYKQLKDLFVKCTIQPGNKSQHDQEFIEAMCTIIKNDGKGLKDK